MRYNFNYLAMHDDQRNVFFKRQFAMNFGQRFGIQTYYHRNIWSALFCFYDIQLSYSKTFSRNKSIWGYDPYVEEPERSDVLCYYNVINVGPFLWLEQNVGLGLKIPLTESISITQKAGVGVLLIFGKEEQLPRTWKNAPVWEVCTLMNIGLTYKF